MKIQSAFRAKVLYILGALICTAGIQFLFSHSQVFKDFYILKLYPFLSSFLRTIFGWFPFSIGDILYVLAGVWFLLGMISFVKKIIKLKRYKWDSLKILLHFIGILITIYFAFLLFWGLNYRYNSVYAEFKISSERVYSENDLKELCTTLAKKLNKLHYKVTGNDTLAVEKKVNFLTIKKQAVTSYRKLAEKNKFFTYHSGSVKPSMFAYFMNYSGVTGYYNPFTGEAQVNTTPPKVEIPFTTCHEIAHQIGFAAEQDANFIGYFVAANSSSPLFRYSANFSLFLYAANNLSNHDKAWTDSLWREGLAVGVKKDYHHYLSFFRQFETPFQDVSNQVYDQYLKANEQKKGIESYSGIVALALNYKKKYGHLP